MIDKSNNKQFVSKKGYYFNYLQFSIFFWLFYVRIMVHFIWDAHPGPSSFSIYSTISVLANSLIRVEALKSVSFF